MKRLIVICLFISCTLGMQAQTASRWEKEIAAFEEHDAANPHKAKLILFTGSSSIRRWDDLASYFPGKRVLNRGFGGSHASDLLQLADRITANHKLKQILIYEGDNDIASGKTTDRVITDLKQIVENLRTKYPKVTIGYLSIKPCPARIKFLPQIKEVNRAMQHYLSDKKKTQYIDVFTPLLNDDGSIKPEIFVADGVHMNAEGYQLWARAISPFLM